MLVLDVSILGDGIDAIRGLNGFVGSSWTQGHGTISYHIPSLSYVQKISLDNLKM